MQDGTELTIIACGELVYEAKKAAETLAAEGKSVRVLDMYCLKPLDTEAVLKAAKETKAILTVEEHSPTVASVLWSPNLRLRNIRRKYAA